MKEYSSRIIGKQIQKYRLSKNYTVKTLSGLSGLSESYIRDLERGRNSDSSSISMKSICKIADALNVTLTDLAHTNIENSGEACNTLLTDIEQEMKTMSSKDLQLFERIIRIFISDKF